MTTVPGARPSAARCRPRDPLRGRGRAGLRFPIGSFDRAGLVLLAVLAFLVGAAPDAHAQPPEAPSLLEFLLSHDLPKRALVIGIRTYDELPEVKNALNDAERVALALEAAGFKVETYPDLDSDALLLRLDDFVDRSLALPPPARAVVAFYFAGHGFARGNENYLVPADAPLDMERLPRESIGLSHVVARILEQPVALAVLFVDSCRNELAGLLPQESVGFVQPVINDTSLYFGFASGMGSPALSFARPEHDTSPFAAALSSNLMTSGLELHDMFENVREQVLDATSFQLPVEYKPFLRKYYFMPSPDYLENQLKDLSWAVLRADAYGSSCMEEYLRDNPAGPYSNGARAWLARYADPLATPRSCP